MSNLVKREDIIDSDTGKIKSIKITIPIEVMRSVAGSIASARIKLALSSGAQESDLIKNYRQYDKSKFCIPFRILDGEFYPYFETFIRNYNTICEPSENTCVPEARTANMLITHIGTFMIEEDMPTNRLASSISMSDRFDIPKLIGVNARSVHLAVGDFGVKYWNNIALNKSLELILTPHVYSLISISSSKDYVKVPMYLDISETDNSEEGADNLENSQDLKNALSVSSDKLRAMTEPNNNIDSSVLRVMYPLTASQHTCLSAIGKIKLQLQNSAQSAVKIPLGLDDSIEVITKLAKPSELNGQINCGHDSEFYIDIALPTDFANLLVKKIDMTSPDFKNPALNTNSKVEIILGRLEFPYIEEDLERTMITQIKNFKVLTPSCSNNNLIGSQEVVSQLAMNEILTGCASYLTPSDDASAAVIVFG